VKRAAHIILPFILLLSLLVQAALPWAQAKATEFGFNAAPYLCNLEGRAPSLEAKAQIKQLLKLAGKDTPSDDLPVSSSHCSLCIIPSLAVLESGSIAAQVSFIYVRSAIFPKDLPEIYVLAQGPPLGPRAPPLSVSPL